MNQFFFSNYAEITTVAHRQTLRRRIISFNPTVAAPLVSRNSSSVEQQLRLLHRLHRYRRVSPFQNSFSVLCL